jgi:DNA-binding ferritin-like protein
MKITLLDAAKAAFLFRNDLHCLHHNITGIDFKDIHEWYGELYDRALDNYDYFVEHAILTKEIEAGPNITSLLLDYDDSIIKYWNIIKGNTLYTIEQSLKLLIEQWKDYSEILDFVREYCDRKKFNDITSDIDQIKSDWSIDIQYKAIRTLQ